MPAIVRDHHALAAFFLIYYVWLGLGCLAAVVRPSPLPPHRLDGYRDQKPERDESPHDQGFIHRQQIHHVTRPLEVSIGTEYHDEEGGTTGPIPFLLRRKSA